MLYHKVELLTKNTTINIPLYDDEIFCICPGCEIEMEVDHEMIKSIIEGQGDFSGTSFYCADCTRKKIYKE